jgi:hypothetical protein
LTGKAPYKSAANSSLKMPNSLLAGKIQGISSIRASAAPRRQSKVHQNSILRANSLRIRTGNFLRPCREFKLAIREVSARIRESRAPVIWGPTKSDPPERSRTHQIAARSACRSNPGRCGLERPFRVRQDPPYRGPRLRERLAASLCASRQRCGRVRPARLRRAAGPVGFVEPGRPDDRASRPARALRAPGRW